MKSLFGAILVTLCCCLTNRLAAKVVLPSVISDNMVLQQQSKVLLWGYSTISGTVTIITSWNHKKVTVKCSSNNKWTAWIQTPAAGGPYKITFVNGEAITLKNVLIGEVWFCGGQSNMEMPVRGFRNQPVLESNEILAGADNPQIRLFKTKRASSTVPLDSCSGIWQVADAASVKDFSAVAYEYGRYLQAKLKVPVGLVLSCWGGTMIETWMSRDMLAPFPDIKLPDSIDPKAGDNQPPSALFNGMIAPLAGYGIKGFIWYQGESNRREPELYQQLFPAMVAGWRKCWNMGELPFYYVQIAPFASKDTVKGSGPKLREAQLNCMRTIPNSGMAVTLDIGKEKYIHPPDKTTVGKRLAYWALAKTYHHEGIGYCGPVYSSMTVQKNKLIVRFDQAADGLTSFGKELSNFEIAGHDKKFHPAKASILYDRCVEVYSDEVQEPVAVRYGFKEWVTGDLYNVEGLPASSFRTDDY